MVDTVSNVKVRVSAENVSGASRDMARWKSNFEKATGGAAASMQRAERQIVASQDRIANALRNTAAVFGVGIGANEIVKAADSYTKLTNGLIAAGTSAEDFANVQDRLYSAAQRNGTQAEALAQLYRRAALAGDALGVSQESLLNLTDGVAAALRVEGISAQEARGPLLQLGQALASPIVRAEELNSIMEGVPEIARAAARGFGVSVAEMRTAILDGEVTNKAFFQALQIGLVETEKLAEKIPLTIGNSFTVLGDALARYIGQTDDSLSATERISGGLQSLAENIDSVVPALAVLSSVIAGKYVGSLAMAAVSRDGFLSQSGSFVGAVLREKEAVRGAALGEAARSKQSSTSTAISVENAQKRVAALNAEVAAYRQNIAMAEQQVASARKVRQATDEATAAMGRRIAVGAGDLSSVKAGQQAQEQATRALIRNRMALSSAEQKLINETRILTAAQIENGAATTRLAIANRAAATAMAATGVAATAGAVAVRGLSAALAFFGGPVGAAIIAVGVAFAYLASEASNTEQEIDDARSAVKDMAETGRQAAAEVAKLTGKVDENAAAALDAKGQTDGLSQSYIDLRAEAMNAAEAVAYLTARQREQRIQELETGQDAISKSIRGGGAFNENQQERVMNAQIRLQKSLGISGSPYFGTFVKDQIEARTEDVSLLTDQQKRLYGIYQAEQQVLGEMIEEERGQKRVLEALYNSRGTATIPKPQVVAPEQTLASLGGGRGGGGSGSSSKASKDRQAEMRQRLENERRLAEVRATGNAKAIQDEEDRQRRAELTASYTEAGYENAAELAKEVMGYEIRIRDLAKEREEIEKRREAYIDRTGKLLDRFEDRQNAIADFAREELEHRQEIARLTGDKAGEEAARRELMLVEQIARYRSIGMNTADATAAANRRVDEIISAEKRGELRDTFAKSFSEGIRAIAAGDIQSFAANMAGSFAEQALQRLGENVFDAIFGTSENIQTGTEIGLAQNSVLTPALIAASATMAATLSAAITTAGAAAAAAIGAAMGSAGAASAFSSLPSFAGGGYTGNAPRSGGLDGKGGFLAMMHPRETVNDLTRGMPSPSSLTGSRGAMEVKQNFTINAQGSILASDIVKEIHRVGAQAVSVAVDRSGRNMRKNLPSAMSKLDRYGTP